MARPQTAAPPPTKEEGEEDAAEAREAFLRAEFRPNYERGCSYYFGHGAIRRFLDANGLLCLVRAHQVQEEGFRRHFDPRRLRPHHHHKRRSSGGGGGGGASPLTRENVRELLPPVITIFSAPNYAGRYGNKVRGVSSRRTCVYGRASWLPLLVLLVLRFDTTNNHD